MFTVDFLYRLLAVIHANAPLSRSSVIWKWPKIASRSTSLPHTSRT